MSEAAPNDSEIPPRGEPQSPFCWIANEVLQVFLPVMGPDCLAIYVFFAGKVFTNPKLRHTVRDLAEATRVGPTTVSRCLEILEYLRLVKLTRFGGSRDSECRLLDSRAAVNRLGAAFDPATLSYSLPPEVASRLKNEVNAIRTRQQGKSLPIAQDCAPPACGNRQSRVSHRNASVSPARRQRSARETQTRTHLIQEERRIEEVPSPTPSHGYEAQKAKDSPDEDEPGALLRWARIKLTGVMKDMAGHLLDTSRPPASHLANGYADWERFGFDSLAVEAAARRGEALALVLSASDPVAAQRGLEKYRKTWGASLRNRYECKVRVELQQAQRKS
jgi:hypothetical protein